MTFKFAIHKFYSIQHLQSSLYFSKRAKYLESNINDDFSEEATFLKSYVTGTILSSVAFLEAFANELYAESQKENGTILSHLSTEIINAISDKWNEDKFERKGVLEKFNALVFIAARDKYIKGQKPYQHTQYLIQLRNSLVHYKAPFFDIGTSVQVREGNFNDSNLARNLKDLFSERIYLIKAIRSDGWLSCGCAEWAFNTAIAHADFTCLALGIEPYYRKNLRV